MSIPDKVLLRKIRKREKTKLMFLKQREEKKKNGKSLFEVNSLNENKNCSLTFLIILEHKKIEEAQIFST